jgi:hypothetical protein
VTVLQNELAAQLDGPPGPVMHSLIATPMGSSLGSPLL